MRRILLFMLIAFAAAAARAQYSVSSPNEQVRVEVSTKWRKIGKFRLSGKKMVDIWYDGKRVVRNREIGLAVKTEGRRCYFGRDLITDVDIKQRMKEDEAERDERLNDLKGAFNRLVLRTEKGMMLEIRAYNNGVAYRFAAIGFPDEYKILEVCDVFAHEDPIAIMGTYDGDYVMPWRTLIRDAEEDFTPLPNTFAKEDFKGAQWVNWRDAPVTVTAGASVNWTNGDAWKGVGQTSTITADMTYKHVYAAVGVVPCQELMYICWGDDYAPFDQVMGSIHSWTATIKGGYSMPFQWGYNIWHISPYIATSFLHLKQHFVHPNAKEIEHKNHVLAGPGVKLQYTMRERAIFGLSYEYQFFTRKMTPVGMNSLTFSIGYMF